MHEYLSQIKTTDDLWCSCGHKEKLHFASTNDEITECIGVSLAFNCKCNNFRLESDLERDIRIDAPNNVGLPCKAMRF